MLTTAQFAEPELSATVILNVFDLVILRGISYYLTAILDADVSYSFKVNEKLHLPNGLTSDKIIRRSWMIVIRTGRVIP